MQSFQWSSVFLTGLDTVDEQHRELVDIINRLGVSIGENATNSDEHEQLCQRLTEYATYHFREEEALMREVGLDRRHIDEHLRMHGDFLRQVRHMQSDAPGQGRATQQELMSFLTHWLAHHILGCDQIMAAQMRAIENGETAAEAFDRQVDSNNQSTEPLLTALNGLFQLVSSRNRALSELNQSLERKVAERTRALAEANHHLEALALTDPLTGLPNRRHAMNQLTLMWIEAVTSGRDLACMMIDADNFKQVNDNHGHDAGDAVLLTLARALQHAVRTDDMVCRLGGDEFFIICPSTDQHGVMKAAGQVLKAVNALDVPTGMGNWRGSVSIGAAARNAAMGSHEALIKAADNAVYLAKRAGRNCVRPPAVE